MKPADAPERVQAVVSERAGYMVVLEGPIKVDLFPEGGHRDLQPPWEAGRGTLAAIDGHFWDWVLWLGGKSLRHETGRVAGELAKMHWFLLTPLGVEDQPGSIQDAVSLYLEARAEASRRFRTRVPDELGTQVRQALRSHGLIR